MRILEQAPDAAIDPHTGTPRFGSYLGALPRVDLKAVTGGHLARIARRKRWLYFMIASDDLLVAICVVRLGYVANAFAYAFDRRTLRMRATRSAIAPPVACEVGDTGGEGCVARFRFGGARVSIERPRGSMAYVVEASFKDFELRALVDSTGAPPPLTAIAPIPGGRVNTTEKRALMEASGEITIEGQRFSLDGALAGTDYTHGLLARHTAWRWAYLLGYAKTGERVGMNLVQGFVGEPECAVWIDGDVFPLSEGRFAFDRDRPLDEWRISTADGGVSLRFSPGGMHAERRSLGLVKTNFVQPAGIYTGAIRTHGGREIRLDRVLGVAEDQDVIW
jgi:hypothetical protein